MSDSDTSTLTKKEKGVTLISSGSLSSADITSSPKVNSTKINSSHIYTTTLNMYDIKNDEINKINGISLLNRKPAILVSVGIFYSKLMMHIKPNAENLLRLRKYERYAADNAFFNEIKKHNIDFYNIMVSVPELNMYLTRYVFREEGSQISFTDFSQCSDRVDQEQLNLHIGCGVNSLIANCVMDKNDAPFHRELIESKTLEDLADTTAKYRPYR
ncbi:hypothetical protein [Plesiomonas sp.]|uniref:hypothetical protein n=1 Tax=Plesiomonas sp. TaxID=2486279 RepID=UPI003F3EFF90